MVQVFTQLALVASLMSSVVLSAPMILPPGSKPIKYNPDFPIHILKREPIVLPEGSKPFANWNPHLPYHILKREPIFLPPGSEPITDFDPDFPYHILKREPEPFVLPEGGRPIFDNPDLPFHALKREPIVLPPGSEPFATVNPDHPFYILKREPEPFVLPDGSKGIDFNPNLPFHALKREPEPAIGPWGPADTPSGSPFPRPVPLSSRDFDFHTCVAYQKGPHGTYVSAC
jgi:hypothetical protein